MPVSQAQLQFRAKGRQTNNMALRRQRILGKIYSVNKVVKKPNLCLIILFAVRFATTYSERAVKKSPNASLGIHHLKVLLATTATTATTTKHPPSHPLCNPLDLASARQQIGRPTDLLCNMQPSSAASAVRS